MRIPDSAQRWEPPEPEGELEEEDMWENFLAELHCLQIMHEKDAGKNLIQRLIRDCIRRAEEILVKLEE